MENRTRFDGSRLCETLKAPASSWCGVVARCGADTDGGAVDSDLDGAKLDAVLRRRRVERQRVIPGSILKKFSQIGRDAGTVRFDASPGLRCEDLKREAAGSGVFRRCSSIRQRVKIDPRDLCFARGIARSHGI